MPRSRPSFLPALLLAALCACAAPPAADPAPAPAQLTPEQMAEMMRLAQPGPEHAELAKFAGEWEGEVSIWMAPGAEPMKQAATASSRVVLDGRFVHMTSHGDFFGQPFEGISMFGFDRRNDVYTVVGFDSLGTYYVTGAGTRQADGVIRLHGRDVEPLGDQNYWFEIEWLNDDEFLSSVVFVNQGPTVYDPPFKMVETHYRRK